MMIKNKILTTISTILLFIPWSILLLRRYEWALQSPAAEIMIAGYAIFMIFSGIFTGISYGKANVRNNWMKVCLVINVLYAAAGVLFLGMMVNSQSL